MTLRRSTAVLMLALLPPFLVSCGGGHESAHATPTKYTNEKFNFSFTYDAGMLTKSQSLTFRSDNLSPQKPANWAGVFLGSPMANFALARTPVLEVGFWDKRTPADGLVVVATRYDSRYPLTAAEMASIGSTLADGLKTQGEVQSPPPVARVRIHGLSGVRIAFACAPVNYVWVVLAGKQYVYMIALAGDSKKWPAISPALKAAVQSFKTLR